MPSPKLDILAEATLLRLFLVAQTHDENTKISEVPGLFKLRITRKQTDLALEILKEKNFCSTEISGYAATASITKLGYLEVEHALEDPASFIYAYQENGDQWLSETGGVITANSPDIENTSSVDWEPLPVERDDPQLKKAVAALDTAITEIESDNGYSATEPDERNAVVSSLKTASEALKTQSQIYYFQFRSLIWEPLEKAGKRFGNAATGLSIQAAKEALKEVFKDWIKGGMNS
ncbi:MAG: hypothetical protein JKY63_02910 [Rhodobiaceae bacterium]|nr:hypothetical protein [Rhodobiaceae bacterium]